jgi:O-antigen/teichoic acid export membrane protein
VCALGAWLLGVPVLSALFNTDISPYRVELCVLVVGGGFLSLVTLYTIGATILRKQTLLLGGYGAVSVLAFFLSAWAVRQWGISGASWVYLALMALLALTILATFVASAFVVRRVQR